MGPGIFVVVAVVGLLAMVRLFKGNMDQDRIHAYFSKRDEKVVNIEWAPLSPGFFVNRTDRYYQVTYVDAQGQQHPATCRTSGWTGVYLTEPSPPSPPPLPSAAFGTDIPPPMGTPSSGVASSAPSVAELEGRVRELEAENERLRKELSRAQDYR